MHLVRVGLIGQVGRFRAADGVVHPRGTPVVVRTARGLERGLVLSHGRDVTEADGLLLRRMTPEDELLEARLERHKHEALAACERAIAERGIDATLKGPREALTPDLGGQGTTDGCDLDARGPDVAEAFRQHAGRRLEHLPERQADHQAPDQSGTEPGHRDLDAFHLFGVAPQPFDEAGLAYLQAYKPHTAAALRTQQ